MDGLVDAEQRYIIVSEDLLARQALYDDKGVVQSAMLDDIGPSGRTNSQPEVWYLLGAFSIRTSLTVIEILQAY